MVKLETTLAVFKTSGINKDSSKPATFKYVLDFQDAIGHATMNELLEWYTGKDQNERKHFIWCCSNCLSMDVFIDIIKHVVCNATINDIEESYSELYSNRVARLEEREKDIEKNESLVKQVENLTYIISLKDDQISGLNNDIVNLNDNSTKYLKIKELLK